MVTIEVSVQDFAASHKGLIHLLKTVDKAGGKISTRKLLSAMRDWGYHGHKMIKKAEEEGFIEREEGESERGQFPPIYNIITTKGKDLLLGQLQQEQGEEE